MRNDLFRDKKGIHIKLNKTTHAEFRKVMFDKGLSMQHAFEEFAAQVGKGNKSAMKIINDLVAKELRGEIEKLTTKRFDELDHEALYHLIEQEKEEKDENIEVDSSSD